MKRLNSFVCVGVMLIISFIFISSAHSDDSRERLSNYFSESSSKIGPQLPDLDELRRIIKGGITLNYKGQPGSPSVLYRLGNIPRKVHDVPREQVDEHMKNMLDILVKGGLEIRGDCSENTYEALLYNMHTYLSALMQYGGDLSKINIGSEGDPDIVNSIDLADKWGHDDLVEIFIKYGSKTQPEQVRAQLRLVGGADTLKKSQIIDAVKRGAAINAPDMYGKTALQELLESNNVVTKEGVDVLKLLLDLGSTPNLPYKTGDYPLYAFIEDKGLWRNTMDYKGYDIQIIDMLIKSGALVSSKNGLLKRTPLHAAAERNYYEAARILVENGAKIMALDGTGKTPLDLTESGQIVKLLKDNGAKERGY